MSSLIFIPEDTLFEIASFCNINSFYSFCLTNKKIFKFIFLHEKKRNLIFYNLFLSKVKDSWYGEKTIENIKTEKEKENWTLCYQKDLEHQKIKPFKVFNFEDEVLHGTWSNNGDYAAFASKDTSLIIYDVKKDSITFKESFEKTLNYVKFNPSSTSFIFTLVDVEIETLECYYYSFQEKKQKALFDVRFNNFPKWLDDNTLFYVQRSFNHSDKFILYNLITQETITQTIRFPKYKFYTEMSTLSNDKSLILFVCSKHKYINLIKYIKISEMKSTSVDDLETIDLGTCFIAQFCVTLDDKQLVVNTREVLKDENELKDEFEIFLIDIKSKTKLQSYKSHTCSFVNTNFMIFPNVSKEYIICGGQDKLIYIWNLKYGHLVSKFTYHDNIVNVVEFNPNFDMFLSVSDDHKAVIWRKY